MFDLVIIKRGQTKWKWQVCNQSGKVIMFGTEKTREGARYRGQRALFVLLLSSSRKIDDPPKNPGGPINP
jgi:hypothetical protein